MEIIKNLENKKLTLTLKGELNTATYRDLEDIISNSLKGIKELVFDFAELSYVSSAGLRVLLVAKKIMDKQGSMVVRHVNSDIMEVFDITGFANILDIE